MRHGGSLPQTEQAGRARLSGTQDYRFRHAKAEHAAAATHLPPIHISAVVPHDFKAKNGVEQRTSITLSP